MTPTGIRIFKSGHRAPFSVRDFKPLAYAGNVPHRRALLAIDNVIRPPEWSSSYNRVSPVAAAWHAPVVGETGSRVIDTIGRS